MKDYYKILGVDRKATKADIQKAFRGLAQKHHPDKKGGSATKFKEINEAYQVLGNDQKRSQYDMGGGTTPGGGTGFSGFEGFSQGGFDFSNIHVNMDRGEGVDISEIFKNVFRGAMNRGEDIEADIIINFESSVYGVTKKVRIPYRRKKTEDFEITIPPGTETGHRLRVSGKGEPAREKGSPSGDLYLRINVEQSRHFKKMNGDVVFEMRLTPIEALLGAEKEIPDISSGTIPIRIPELSKDGTVVAIQGRGIPRPHGTGRLIVLCHVVYPKSISRKARHLFEELRKEGW